MAKCKTGWIMAGLMIGSVAYCLAAEKSDEALKDRSGEVFKESFAGGSEDVGYYVYGDKDAQEKTTTVVGPIRKQELNVKAVPVPERPLDQNSDMEVFAYLKKLTPEQFAALDPATKANLKDALLRVADESDPEMAALDSFGQFLKVPSYPLSVRAHWEGSQAQKNHRSWVNKQKLVAWGAIAAAVLLMVADISTGGVGHLLIATAVIALVGLSMFQVLRLILGIPTYGDC